jgi:ParB/RepB/Spo0J family partition protein
MINTIGPIAMTSGDFHSVFIDSIIVEDRQRNELTDIPELADSISRLGLIHPIVVQRDNLLLVSGERRLAACKMLGHDRIMVQYYDEVDEYTRHAIEYEENTKRKDFSPQERCLGALKYLRHRRIVEPDFSQADMAKAIGLKPGHISQLLGGARAIEAGNQRVIEALELSRIFTIVRLDNKRRDDEEHERWFGNAAPIEKPDDPVLNLDFNEWAKTYNGARFNFVHCDFPYGIESDSFNQGGAATHGGYDDTPETYRTLCKTLCENLDRLCTDSCHFMFWFSMKYYQPTLDFFAKHSDIKFDPFPLVWVKSDNAGILYDRFRGVRRIYETAFFGSRGDRMIASSVPNAFCAPTDQSTHMSIKPEPVLQNFFRMFVDGTTLMLDPTAGSGSSLRAAESLGAKHVLGLEINKGFCEDANRSFRNARAARDAAE